MEAEETIIHPDRPGLAMLPVGEAAQSAGFRLS
jgi:hypothetical protein